MPFTKENSKLPARNCCYVCQPPLPRGFIPLLGNRPILSFAVWTRLLCPRNKKRSLTIFQSNKTLHRCDAGPQKSGMAAPGHLVMKLGLKILPNSLLGYFHFINLVTVVREPYRGRWNGTGIWEWPRIFFHRSAWSTLIHLKAMDLKNVFHVLRMAWGRERNTDLFTMRRVSPVERQGLLWSAAAGSVGMVTCQGLASTGPAGPCSTDHTPLPDILESKLGGFILLLKLGTCHGLFNLENQVTVTLNLLLCG